MSVSTGGEHAVVIGGSMAGLLAAQVLADRFARVTLLERDHYPAGPEPRKGVPQARHVHALLVSGLQALEELFPGLESELEAAGAPCLDWTADMAWFGSGRWGRRFRSSLAGRTCSRPLLEWLVHRRLANTGRVQIVEGSLAAGLIAGDAGGRVSGVKVRRVGTGEAETNLFADLIVDASGRASRAAEWLQVLGYPAPQETVINAYLGYASRWYRRPPGLDEDWKVLVVRTQPPDHTRGGVIMEVEEGRWIVTLGGVSKDYPPTDEAGFLEFTRSLATPKLYTLLKDAEPLTPIQGYQRTENRWRHWERLARTPEGLVVLGDAACAFNPVYGQGMTVAALGALALGDCLDRQGGRGKGLPHRFQARLAQVISVPWILATGEDFRWPATEGGRPAPASRFMHWYTDRLLELCLTDERLQKTFIEVTHLLRPPRAFFRPRTIAKVLAYGLRPPSPTPAEAVTFRATLR